MIPSEQLQPAHPEIWKSEEMLQVQNEIVDAFIALGISYEKGGQLGDKSFPITWNAANPENPSETVTLYYYYQTLYLTDERELSKLSFVHSINGEIMHFVQSEEGMRSLCEWYHVIAGHFTPKRSPHMAHSTQEIHKEITTMTDILASWKR